MAYATVHTQSQLTVVSCEDVFRERVVITCGDCGEYVSIYPDPWGYWVECDCDFGYAFNGKVSGIIMHEYLDD